MAELHIDDDWKKQAQEEKRKLAEEEQKRAAEREQRERAAAPMASSPAMLDPVAPPAGADASRSAAGPARGRSAAGAPSGNRERSAPEASVSSLINSLATQALLYLGVLAPRGVEPQLDLDMAKFNVDLLGILEVKTRGNLTEEEQKLLDNVLYEVRTRYVAVASQYATV
jgi:hypothetical protein